MNLRPARPLQPLSPLPIDKYWDQRAEQKPERLGLSALKGGVIGGLLGLALVGGALLVFHLQPEWHSANSPLFGSLALGAK